MQTRSHTETFQPSQALSRIEEIRTTEKKEASRERENQEAPLSFHLFSRSHFTFSLLSLLPRFRSSQTDRSCQTFDVFIHLGRDLFLQVCVCVCGCQPKFLTSS